MSSLSPFRSSPFSSPLRVYGARLCVGGAGCAHSLLSVVAPLLCTTSCSRSPASTTATSQRTSAVTITPPSSRHRLTCISPLLSPLFGSWRRGGSGRWWQLEADRVRVQCRNVEDRPPADMFYLGQVVPAPTPAKDADREAERQTRQQRRRQERSAALAHHHRTQWSHAAVTARTPELSQSSAASASLRPPPHSVYLVLSDQCCVNVATMLDGGSLSLLLPDDRLTGNGAAELRMVAPSHSDVTDESTFGRVMNLRTATSTSSHSVALTASAAAHLPPSHRFFHLVPTASPRRV